MDAWTFSKYLLVMAGVTYLIRMLPLTLMKRKIGNPFIKSFLYYIPFTVLGAMTFPDILYATGQPLTALPGMVVALVLAWSGRSLLTVALAASAAAYGAQLLLSLW